MLREPYRKALVQVLEFVCLGLITAALIVLLWIWHCSTV